MFDRASRGVRRGWTRPRATSATSLLGTRRWRRHSDRNRHGRGRCPSAWIRSAACSDRCPKCCCRGRARVVARRPNRSATTCRATLLPAPSLATPPGLDHLAVAFAYEGVAREVVARVKYRNARGALTWLATEMLDQLARRDDARRRHLGADHTAAPPLAAGFDHAELLARAVGRTARLPVRGLLTRLPGPGPDRRRAGGAQGGATLPGPPRCRRPRGPAGGRRRHHRGDPRGRCGRAPAGRRRRRRRARRGPDPLRKLEICSRLNHHGE